MFGNKHIAIALLVAPMLAIIAWFAVDYFVAERPHAAVPGGSYPLVAKPNCRRPSEGCELANSDLTVTLAVPEFDAAAAKIDLTSTFPLERAAIGIANTSAVEGAPDILSPTESTRLSWRGSVSGPIDRDSTLRVLVWASGASFYAEVPVTFFYTE